MKLIYNDGTDLQIQSASIQGDGTLLIKTVSATEEDLRGADGENHPKLLEDDTCTVPACP